MCSCKSHATLCLFPFIYCRSYTCACCIQVCACMHVCDGVGMWGLMSSAVPYTSTHDPHYVEKKQNCSWNCMFASSMTRKQQQLRAISLQKRNHIDSMLGRQVRTQVFLIFFGYFWNAHRNVATMLLAGAVEWTRWNQSVRAFCSVARYMLLQVCSPETKWFPCPLCLQDGCYVFGSWNEGSHSLLKR